MWRATSPRHATGRIGVVLAALLLIVLVVAQSAGADPISDKKKQAVRLADQLEQLTTRTQQLAEQYDEAVYKLQVLDAQVRDAEALLAQKRAEMLAASLQTRAVALHIFVHTGQSDDPLLSALAGIQNASDGLLRATFAHLAIGQGQRSTDELRRSRLDAEAVDADLQAKHRDQAAAAKYLATKKKELESATAQVHDLLAHVNGDVARLVAQEQERRAAAAAAVSRALLARQRNSTGGGSGPQRVRRPPPPPSPGAAGAVAAAMSQLRVRYQWGGASPETGFDCSGLTMWAWARAGRPGLPHFARAQWEGLPHVNIEDLRPGDLVFFGSDVHHMGMYIGNGQMVNAPQTGDVVKISSIYRPDLIGAARP